MAPPATVEAMGREATSQLSVSLFRPLLAADVVEGEWFGIISAGTVRVQVFEWPVQDLILDAAEDAVITFELYLAADKDHFLRGEAHHFSEVQVPAREVHAVPGSGNTGGGLFRYWLGLLRGVEVDKSAGVEGALERLQLSADLAHNLLAPKVCCSILCAPTVGASHDDEVEALRRSLSQHSNIIVRMHQQLQALWTQGRLVWEDSVCRLADDTAMGAGALADTAEVGPGTGGAPDHPLPRISEGIERDDDGGIDGAQWQEMARSLEEALAVERSNAEELHRQLLDERSHSQGLEKRIAEQTHAMTCKDAEVEALTEQLDALSVRLAEAWREQERLRAELDLSAAPSVLSVNSSAVHSPSSGERAPPAPGRAALRTEEASSRRAAARASREVERTYRDELDAARGEFDEFKRSSRAARTELSRQVQGLQEALQAEEANSVRCTEEAASTAAALADALAAAAQSAAERSSAIAAQEGLREEVSELEAVRAEAHAELRECGAELRVAREEVAQAAEAAAGYANVELRIAQMEAQVRGAAGPGQARAPSALAAVQPLLRHSSPQLPPRQVPQQRSTAPCSPAQACRDGSDPAAMSTSPAVAPPLPVAGSLNAAHERIIAMRQELSRLQQSKSREASPEVPVLRPTSVPRQGASPQRQPVSPGRSRPAPAQPARACAPATRHAGPPIAPRSLSPPSLRRPQAPHQAQPVLHRVQQGRVQQVPPMVAQHPAQMRAQPGAPMAQRPWGSPQMRAHHP